MRLHGRTDSRSTSSECTPETIVWPLLFVKITLVHPDNLQYPIATDRYPKTLHLNYVAHVSISYLAIQSPDKCFVRSAETMIN